MDGGGGGGVGGRCGRVVGHWIGGLEGMKLYVLQERVASWVAVKTMVPRRRQKQQQLTS